MDSEGGDKKSHHGEGAAVVCAGTQAKLIDPQTFSRSKATGWRFDLELQRQNSLRQPCVDPRYLSVSIPKSSRIPFSVLSSDILQPHQLPPADRRHSIRCG
jgi:hypothetical protein